MQFVTNVSTIIIINRVSALSADTSIITSATRRVLLRALHHELLHALQGAHALCEVLCYSQAQWV